MMMMMKLVVECLDRQCSDDYTTACQQIMPAYGWLFERKLLIAIRSGRTWSKLVASWYSLGKRINLALIMMRTTIGWWAARLWLKMLVSQVSVQMKGFFSRLFHARFPQSLIRFCPLLVRTRRTKIHRWMDNIRMRRCYFSSCLDAVQDDKLEELYKSIRPIMGGKQTTTANIQRQWANCLRALLIVRWISVQRKRMNEYAQCRESFAL